MKKTIVGLVLVNVFILSCKKEETGYGYHWNSPSLPYVDYDYESIVFPDHFDEPMLNFINSIPADNPITNKGAKLGRVLFYDTRLSKNNTISCGSCHRQENGFSDPNQYSEGFLGGFTNRNSMAILNMRFSNRFFWDNRVFGLESQVLMPIQNHIEMGMDLNDLESKLTSIPYYKDLFNEAFGSPEITSDKIAKALAQFLQSMVSYNTKYDQGVDIGFNNFTELEKDGHELFFSGPYVCAGCHITVNFYQNFPLNNGLDSVYTDNGVGALSGIPAEMGLFKVPTLRNIAVTAPYMHDGRFATLEQVIEHYNSGLQQHPNLDDRLTVDGYVGGTPKKNLLTEYDKKALVAFLKTLTDYPLLTDPKFSDPFK